MGHHILICQPAALGRHQPIQNLRQAVAAGDFGRAVAAQRIQADI